MRGYFLYLCIMLGWALQGQIEHPKASPFAEIRQDVGLTTLNVEYSRPAVRGRTIFGDLVPYGRIWRVGANASTKFSTNTRLTIQDHVLEPGTYALYAFPYETYWEVVFHTNTGHWGDGRTAYNPEEDAFRIRVTPGAIPDKQENFLISFDHLTHNSILMHWTWDHTRISVPIAVDTRAVMQRAIEDQIAKDPSPQTYYEAARYYQEEGIQSETALEYLNKALAMGGDTYYFHRVRSLVLAQLGRYEEALVSARKSLTLAAEEGKDEFVRMNEKNIRKWSAKQR